MTLETFLNIADLTYVDFLLFQTIKDIGYLGKAFKSEIRQNSSEILKRVQKARKECAKLEDYCEEVEEFYKTRLKKQSRVNKKIMTGVHCCSLARF